MTGSVFVFLLPLLLPPSGALRGALLSESAEPLANARIWILELALSERTRSDGTFVFENVPPGTYQILAETDIRAVATREATVEAGRTTELALTAELDLLRVNEVVTVTGRADELIGVSDSASEGVVGQKDLEARAVLRPGDLLETVPGMVATQHSGGGKANQFFLRGFNLDHGTDFRVTLDGIPVNMPSHGHGQGYTDLNFLIPELVEKVSYRKGPYFVEEGDFSAAGAARLTFFNRLDSPLFRVAGGEFGYARALAAGSLRVGGGNLPGRRRLHPRRWALGAARRLQEAERSRPIHPACAEWRVEDLRPGVRRRLELHRPNPASSRRIRRGLALSDSSTRPTAGIRAGIRFWGELWRTGEQLPHQRPGLRALVRHDPLLELHVRARRSRERRSVRAARRPHGERRERQAQPDRDLGRAGRRERFRVRAPQRLDRERASLHARAGAARDDQGR